MYTGTTMVVQTMGVEVMILTDETKLDQIRDEQENVNDESPIMSL